MNSWFVEFSMESDLLRRLADEEITKEQLLEAVKRDFDLLPQVIEGVSSSKARVRYGCAKVLVDLSVSHPAEVYSHMDFFVSLLDSEHRILVWNAVAIVANLCAVDSANKFDVIFDKYYGFLNDEYMVTVANVVGSSAKIALAKPYLVPRITAKLLHVDKISTSAHLTEECRRVIAEKTIDAFNKFFNLMDMAEKTKALSFAKKNADSSRVSLKKKADAFLKRWNL